MTVMPGIVGTIARRLRCEAENVRCSDQQNSDPIIDHAVNADRDGNAWRILTSDARVPESLPQ
jgi:hypothetical protein